MLPVRLDQFTGQVGGVAEGRITATARLLGRGSGPRRGGGLERKMNKDFIEIGFVLSEFYLCRVTKHSRATEKSSQIVSLLYPRGHNFIMSGIFLYKKNTKIIVNKTCVTYVMVKAILRTKRIIFHESNTEYKWTNSVKCFLSLGQ